MELKNYFAQDDQGNALGGATCFLYQRGTESQASGLQKANGVALLNPFKADEAGKIQFAAPNGLYDLRVVHGARDYRIQVQLNDMDDGVAAVKSAADRAEAARDVALLEADLFTSVAAGLLATVSGQGFQVLSPQNSDYLILYLNQAGVAVEQRRYPTAAAVEAIRSLVQTSSTGGGTEYLEVSDEEGARAVLITDKRFDTPGFNVVSEDATTQLGDSEGAAVLYADDQRIMLGGLEIRPTHLPGIYVVDENDAVVQELSSVEPLKTETVVSPFEGGLLFAPVIATAENQDSFIYPQNLLVRRELAAEVVATLASTTTPLATTGTALAINASKYGGAAVLNLRNKAQSSDRRFMPLTLKNVPVQSPPIAIKVLIIGDSIGNRQGGYLLKQYLQALGVNATFIGTMFGSADANSGGSTNGELGECREGWETGDYTNAIVDRALILAPGDEAAYLAMSKNDQRDRNPFARAAAAEDPAGLVRNGYVFDCAFYQSRFGLDTPDIVIQSLGTNDVRDRTATSIYDHVYNNDTIINGQIRKAWPSAKIIRTLPGTAVNAVRNELWANSYTPVIRAMQQSAVDRADSKTIIAPLWAMTNPEGAYALPAGPAANDGFLVGDWSDPIHPIGAARLALYQALAPFVAAAALNLI